MAASAPQSALPIRKPWVSRTNIRLATTPFERLCSRRQLSPCGSLGTCWRRIRSQHHRATPSAPSGHRIAVASARPLDSLQGARKGAAAVITTRNKRSRRRSHRAAARVIERKLLLVAPRSRLLARFVDRSTELVKRNVAARCTRLRGRHHRKLPRFICHVWLQPRSPASGVAVVCHTKHRQFWVTAYGRRRTP